MPQLGKRFLGLVLIASFSSCFALPSPFSRGSHYLGSVLSLSKVLLLILKISLLILNKFFNQTQPPFFLPPLLGFEQVSPECSTETPRKVSFFKKTFPSWLRPWLGIQMFPKSCHCQNWFDPHHHLILASWRIWPTKARKCDSR